MKFFLFLVAVFLLAGCSPADKMLEESKPKKTTIGEQATEKQQAQKPPQQTQAAPPVQSSKPMYQSAPELTINKSKKYTATLTTSKGPIEIELFASATPITVNNFVFLAREKFYDGVIFHRTISDFMIQGGDPTGTGSGGPGYKFADEVFTGEYSRGTVAMANSGPNTNGSQFFIMHKDTPLPKSYVIFGKVTSGMETVDAIATAPTGPNRETPQTPTVIESVTINEQ
jgi:cyclophilin family peptidyl-prolyl cis-trans isomerase